jgi:hypothetical protein
MKLFGPNREEVIGGWRKMHRDLYSLIAVRKIKSRKMR